MELFEYEDYLSAPNRGNASAFITMAIEQNLSQLIRREKYLEYIAKRPRAQRFGAHGLFTGDKDSLVLSQTAKAIAEYPGNVWLPIISLRREDAARLGYDNAENWKSFLSSYAMQMATAMKIPGASFDGTQPSTMSRTIRTSTWSVTVQILPRASSRKLGSPKSNLVWRSTSSGRN